MTGDNRVALGTRQARGKSDNVGEPKADKETGNSRNKVGAERERDVIMDATAGENKMAAATSND